MNEEQKIRLQESISKNERRKNSLLISESYPEVLEIALELYLDYPNAFSKSEDDYKRFFYPNEKAYFEIQCLNRDCLFSDLSLDNEVHQTIKSRKTISKGTKSCHGFNTFSCYKNKNGSCMTRLDYVIKIKYNAL